MVIIVQRVTMRHVAGRNGIIVAYVSFGKFDYTPLIELHLVAETISLTKILKYKKKIRTNSVTICVGITK